MPIVLLLMFIGVPILEIVLFIEIGDFIGLWPTIFFVLVTAICGTILLRIQGLTIVRSFQTSLARSELPVQEVFNGLCVLIAGILLLTPGFSTDAIGFLLLMPAGRQLIGNAFSWWVARYANIQFHANAEVKTTSTNSKNHATRRGKPDLVIDGDYEEIGPQSPPVDNVNKD